MLILTNGSVNHASDYMCGNSEDQQNLKSSFPKGITGDPFGLLREKKYIHEDRTIIQTFTSHMKTLQ